MELLKRTFGIDFRCARCRAKMVVVAVVKDSHMIRLTLEALGLCVEPPDILPARPCTVFTHDW
jgi:hypothetical protein